MNAVDNIQVSPHCHQHIDAALLYFTDNHLLVGSRFFDSRLGKCHYVKPRGVDCLGHLFGIIFCCKHKYLVILQRKQMLCYVECYALSTAKREIGVHECYFFRGFFHCTELLNVDFD